MVEEKPKDEKVVPPPKVEERTVAHKEFYSSEHLLKEDVNILLGQGLTFPQCSIQI